MPENSGWVSPQRLTEDPKLVLFSDQNVWNSTWVTVPHGPRGQIKTGSYKGTGITPSGGKNPKQLGAAGGNVATLDGAVGETQTMADKLSRLFGRRALGLLVSDGTRVIFAGS
jgi:hypothetical protein